MEGIEIVFVDVTAAEEGSVGPWRRIRAASSSSREGSGNMNRCVAILGRGGDGVCAADVVGLEIRRRGVLVGYG